LHQFKKSFGKVKKEILFDQFPPVSTSEWMDKITSDLKGADFSRKLVWKTNDGFDVMPFYRMEDNEKLPFINTLPGQFPYLRGTRIKNNNWLVRQNIEVTDYPAANRKALTVLMKGIDSLGFIIADPDSVCRSNFEDLLKDIHIEIIEINFLCNGKAKEILEILRGIVLERGLKPEGITGAIEADPLGRLMSNGTLCVPVDAGLDYLASLTKSASLFPKLKTIHLNASHFSNAGANIVQELAFGLSAGSEYMSQLISRGVDPELAASKIRFSFGTGPDYFLEIAKLRAARLLWCLVVKGFIPAGYEKTQMTIHCVTSRWNKTAYDAHVNMLRTQTEAMSAILGGTDSLTIEPFDNVFRKPSEFSERIARNQQLILKEEAYFDKVADPGAGSYYIENLTNLIAENTWKLFVKTDEAGGFLEAVKSGFVQKEIAVSAGKKKKDASSGRLILLGTNQYPNNNEAALETIDEAILFGEKQYEKDLDVDPIIPFRAASGFEKLRIAVEKSGRKPVVFMLTIGNVAMRKARSRFSLNFFGCAGYSIIDNNGFASVAEGVKAALESKSDIVVLCSSDEEYPLIAPEAYEQLNGKTIVVVAGNPPCIEELKSKGLELYIHMKSDLTETIEYFNTRLGIGR